MDLDIRPVTADRWDELERLFGPNGAYSGCWCMYFRQSAKEYDACRGEPNREALRAIVEAAEEPGLLALRDGEPVGWVAVSPRDTFPRILRSRVIKPLDDSAGVWSLPCFYVARAHRRQGVSARLLAAAVAFAAERGAAAVEGYPYDVSGDIRAADAYTGTVSLFTRAGFTIVEPIRAPRRRVMRKVVT